MNIIKKGISQAQYTELVTQLNNTATQLNNTVANMNNYMPKSGGTFTGNVIANETNRSGSYLRNIFVKDSTDNNNVSTSTIKMVRK